MLVSLVTLALLNFQVYAEPWTNASCVAVGGRWTRNERGQTPCLIAAYLAAQCTADNTWGVLANNGGFYNPPTQEQSSVCLCNSVTWSLISACALCQERSAGRWVDWITNCPHPIIGSYPLPLPSGISVPHWAYYDYTVDGIFRKEIAWGLEGAESSAPPTPTATSTTWTVSSPTANFSSGNTSPKVNDKTRAIVAGVIGGIVGLALIAFLIYMIVQKRGKAKPTDPQLTAVGAVSGM